MRIGIMSMQRIKNYGSFLQAFALQQILLEFGHQVEFVDFVGSPEYPPAENKVKLVHRIFLRICRFLKLNNKKLFRLRCNGIACAILYKETFEKKVWSYLRMKETLNLQPSLDLLIIGSDEVFNYVQNHACGYSDELFGSPNNAKRLISFSACCGYSVLPELQTHGYVDRLAGYLRAFDSLSVRDLNSRETVKVLTGVTAEYHLDPVFHYNFDKYLPEISSKENYMVIYAYSNLPKSILSVVEGYARSKGYKIICLLGYQGDVGEFKDADAFEALAYVKNAACVFTSTFHGAVFSIKYKKRFVAITVKRENNLYGNQQKLGDLISRTGLQDRVITSPEQINEILDTEIDYTFANDYIAKTVNDGLTYLKNNTECV